jgi:TPP-dependent pyruvate/acetoin dehydrogenase alpha subunit
MEKIEIAKNLIFVRLAQMFLNEMIKKNEFKIPIHLALGHEAIAVAVDSIMTESDHLVLSHRNIHYNLARSKSIRPEIDEYLLLTKGLGCGQLGSMNLANEKKNISYTSSILGNNLSVAAGIALAKKVKKEEGITLVETGDGAIEEGAFYEGLLFMKSAQLPMLILVENNGWSLATRIKERRGEIDFSKFAESLGIKYRLLKGNNVFEYVEALRRSRESAISEKSPLLIEVQLSTLGGRWVKTQEEPQGHFINYHAGSAPEILIEKGVEIENSDNDPIWVLENSLSKNDFQKIANEVSEILKKEIKQ